MKPMTKILPLCVAALALAATARTARATDLTVTGTATPGTDVYNYDYVFHVDGGGTSTGILGSVAIDNLYLDSDDLSPVSGITFLKNSAPTQDWLWLGNDTPTNYLQFFSFTDSLGVNDTLEAQFSSPASLFVPTGGHFTAGFDTANNQPYVVVNTVVAPTAVPEPGVLPLLGGMLIAGSLLLRRRARA